MDLVIWCIWYDPYEMVHIICNIQFPNWSVTYILVFEPPYMTTKSMIPADYVIDIMDGLPGAPCDNNDRINSLSFMQGSVIGILIVFILLCVTIIVILLRKRKEKAAANQQEAVLVDDKPPQYSREDHRIYHNNVSFMAFLT